MKLEDHTAFAVKYRPSLIILSLLGMITILLSMGNYGIGLSPDSAGYISAARHIAAGMGAVMYDGTPLIAQPPLYPAILAIISYVFRMDPLSFAHIVNAALFGFIVYLSGLLFFYHLKIFAFSLLGTVFILTSFPLIEVSLMAWSEPLFIVFVLLYLVFFEIYLVKADIASLVLFSLSVAFACLTRYIGFIFILTGIFSILLFCRKSPKVKFKHVILFASVSILPIGLWVTRNYVLSGTLFGPRASSLYTLFQNVTFTFNTFLSWYTPWRVPEYWSILMLLSVVVGLLIGFSVKRNWSKVRAFILESSPMLLLITAYVGFLVISSTTTAYDQINNRLLSPVFVPITILILLFVYRIFITLALSEKHLFQKHPKILLVIITVVFLVNPVISTTSLITNAVNQGQGYSSKSWINSPTIEYLLQNRTLESECVIYTNAPDALYILANFSAKMSPMRTMYNSQDLVQDTTDLKGVWPEPNNSCLVWFDKIDRQYLITVDELKAVAGMQQSFRFEDGAVYSVRRK